MIDLEICDCFFAIAERNLIKPDWKELCNVLYQVHDFKKEKNDSLALIFCDIFDFSSAFFE